MLNIEKPILGPLVVNIDMSAFASRAISGSLQEGGTMKISLHWNWKVGKRNRTRRQVVDAHQLVWKAPIVGSSGHWFIASAALYLRQYRYYLAALPVRRSFAVFSSVFESLGRVDISSYH
jgi:hypothetical protein